MPIVRTWEFGTHRASLDDADVIHVSFEGPMTFEDARKVLVIYREICGERPRYLLADIGRSSLDAPTRKFLGEGLQPEWFRGIVYVGANLFLRTITEALISLMYARRVLSGPVRYVATEEEGWAVIAQWKAERGSAG